MKTVIILLVACFVTFEAFSQDDKSILIHPETYPSFPGGSDSLRRFIDRNQKYPDKIKDVKGTVYIQFTINEDGSLSEIIVLRGLNEFCDKNALEIFSKMPKWIPGKMYDKIVKMKMVYPVKYKSSD
jgi:periplasmic protein TonB